MREVNAHHTSTQLNKPIIFSNALDNLKILQLFSTFDEYFTMVGLKLHLLSRRVDRIKQIIASSTCNSNTYHRSHGQGLFSDA